MIHKRIMGGIENYFNPTMGQGQFQNQLIGKGTNVGQLLGQRRHMYEGLAQGNVPQGMRQNILNMGTDLSAQDAFNTQGLLGMGGMQGSNLGSMLDRVSSSGRGNEAINQIANLSPSMMEMGLQGLGDVQRTYQGAQKAGLEYGLSNMAQRGANRRGVAGSMLGFAMNRFFPGMGGNTGGGQGGGQGQFPTPTVPYNPPPGANQFGNTSFRLGQSAPQFQLSYDPYDPSGG